MVIYLYRWKLKPGRESDFEKAWSYVTKQFLEKCGSLGSRLHHGSDGIYYGYAQWPSRELRESARLVSDEVENARALMSDCTVEMLPDIVLDPIL